MLLACDSVPATVLNISVSWATADKEWPKGGFYFLPHSFFSCSFSHGPRWQSLVVVMVWEWRAWTHVEWSFFPKGEGVTSQHALIREHHVHRVVASPYRKLRGMTRSRELHSVAPPCLLLPSGKLHVSFSWGSTCPASQDNKESVGAGPLPSLISY